MIKMIMCSRIYRQSSLENELALSLDPDNNLLWRMNQRRLEAEALRDAMLVASGELDLSPADKSPVAMAGNGIVGRTIKPEQLNSESTKRSVYLPIVRGAVPEILRVFDFPEPSIISGARDVTTVPTQALFMMNDDFVIARSNAFAKLLLDKEDRDTADLVRLAFRRTLSRYPSKRELEAAVEYIQSMSTELLTQGSEQEQALQLAWAGFCQTLFASSEFRYLN